MGILGGAKVTPLVLRQGGRDRPVVSGKLRRRRSERGRPIPKEAGKASRPLRGKRVP